MIPLNEKRSQRDRGQLDQRAQWQCSDDTAASTSRPTPSADNGSVRAHGELGDITLPRRLYLAACGIPPSSNSLRPCRSHIQVVFTDSDFLLCLLAAAAGHLWPCLRFREQRGLVGAQPECGMCGPLAPRGQTLATAGRV
ncbi:hypothetical protein EXN66_Car021043 [Channa argus]|uniref:Uncharacterized protein n=1 Tax=Channa argus TaxID=215402 RepID=A0A6G1QRW8_CHAAH|nr:hypothetical protein EXN66_Car021043 [Channa argus]KAK2882817.1 hypothetical protein Q8A73_021750 [Channa argus]